MKFVLTNVNSRLLASHIIVNVWNTKRGNGRLSNANKQQTKKEYAQDHIPDMRMCFLL